MSDKFHPLDKVSHLGHCRCVYVRVAGEASLSTPTQFTHSLMNYAIQEACWSQLCYVLLPITEGNKAGCISHVQMKGKTKQNKTKRGSSLKGTKQLLRATMDSTNGAPHSCAASNLYNSLKRKLERQNVR